MATYKVIQDIEAEDKLVGPLTLRQFIYAGIAAVSFYICFLSYTKGASFMIGFFLPIGAVGVFFAFPWKGEQPTELWALAKLRFMIKPRVRIWDQDGAKDMVTITVPKKIEIPRGPNADLTQSEVRSRLKALADTIDSRGWATRNAAYGIYGQQWAHPTVAPVMAMAAPSGMSAMIPDDDMFDTKSSVSQNFDAMLNKSSEDQRNRLMQQMSNSQHPTAGLPAPLPNIPTPAASSAYAIAPDAPPMPQQTPYQPPAPQQMAYPQQPQYPQQQPRQPQYSLPQVPQTNGQWFTNGPAYPANPPQANSYSAAAGRIESDMPLATAATPTNEEVSQGQAIMQQNQANMAINYGHLKVLQPQGSPAAAGPAYPAQPDYSQAYTMPQQPVLPAPVTRTPDPAILELANNDDLDIATIARQANKEMNKTPEEVEIRLH